MPVSNRCAYKGCKFVPRTSPELSFHRLPSDKENLRKWISLVGREEWLELEPRKLQNHRICSTHFDQSHFVNNGNLGKRKLKLNALPAQHKYSNDAMVHERSTPVDAPVPIKLESESVPESASEARSPSGTSEKPNESNGDDVTRNRPQITQRERLLMKKNASLAAALKKSRQTVRNLTRRRAVKKLTIPEVIAGAANYLDEDSLLLVKMQFKRTKTSPWSDNEKEFALSLFRKSPEAYVFLRSKLNLPCLSIVRRWAKEKPNQEPELAEKQSLSSQIVC